MKKNMDKDELVRRIARQTAYTPEIAGKIIDAALEEIYQSLKRGESVSLRNFGTFYIDWRHTGTVFKFNPAQRLRAMFGWSSTYKGEL